MFNLHSSDNTNINNWLTEMNAQLEVRQKDTYFVTHGFGSIAALKYIEQLDQQIEGFFSISGFKEDAQDIDENINLEGIHIDYENVKSKVDHFYGLTSKDDRYVSYQETKTYGYIRRPFKNCRTRWSLFRRRGLYYIYSTSKQNARVYDTINCHNVGRSDCFGNDKLNAFSRT